MKKRWLLPLLAILLAGTLSAPAQSPCKAVQGCETVIEENGDTTFVIHLRPVYVFNRKVDLRRYRRLVEAVKRVYPVAQAAKAQMSRMEEQLSRIESRKEQRKYIRGIAAQIEREYTPVLKHMTRTQGRVLLKLIDRETDCTAYEILREFRGGFVAGFWQGISRIFGQNLKSEYDAAGDDRLLELIIRNYEAGLL